LAFADQVADQKASQSGGAKDVDILEVRKKINAQQAQKTKPEVEERSGPSAILEAVNGNTNAILDLMEQIEALKTKKAKDGPANPFEVIEDFKRRLAESGFRGTLTLTIGEDG
jgi:hypothetical protein